MPPMHRDVDVLLIGGGIASARCARTLRRRKFAGSILLVGDEPDAPYNRPPLSKELLRGEVSFDLIAAEPEPWYARQNVELLTDTPVVSLDPDACLATLADGSTVRFGQCLLATGAAARRPSLVGAEDALLLRTLTDAKAIRGRIASTARATIVGGGFIGVEVAASLTALDIHATVLEMAPALWGGVLGPEVSSWAVAVLRNTGVDVRLGASVTSLHPAAADLAILAVGVTPRVELAVGAGLAVDDGVVIDASYGTSAPGIFAAGDVARMNGRRVEHWHAAREGGDAVALAMLGEPLPAPRAPWVYSEFAGHMLDVVGYAPNFDETVALAAGSVVAYLVDDRVAQLAIIDSAVPVAAARELVARLPSLRDVTALIASTALPALTALDASDAG